VEGRPSRAGDGHAYGHTTVPLQDRHSKTPTPPAHRRQALASKRGCSTTRMQYNPRLGSEEAGQRSVEAQNGRGSQSAKTRALRCDKRLCEFFSSHQQPPKKIGSTIKIVTY